MERTSSFEVISYSLSFSYFKHPLSHTRTQCLLYSYLQYNISLLDVSIPSSKAFRRDVLYKDVAG